MKQGTYNPALSIVATCRNDEHGGNLLQRLQLFLNSLLTQSKQYNLDIELILVEWNPPLDRPRLVEALSWPSDPGSCRVRIIEVPSEIHQRFKYSEHLPLFQMLAKNVGIRRAFGGFILATNIDILFSDKLICFLASGRLKNKYYYRADRYDVALDAFSDVSHESLLELCSQNVIRICDYTGVHDLRKGRFFSIHKRKNWRTWLQKSMQDWGLAPVTHPNPLHTNACGDFTLMSRESWFDLRGYPELEIFSFHIDSLGIHTAYHSGLREKILKDPMKIYHIEHSTGSGWTPEGQTKLNNRISLAGIRQLSSAEFNHWGIRMRNEGRPIIFANEDWGLANENLPERFVYGDLEPEVIRRNKHSSSKENPQTIVSHLKPERISATSHYLVIDPKLCMSKHPLVSVVIPSLNRADFLVPTIESVLQQSYPHIECIVVDGGSTDDTIKILMSYGDRIKWISEPDRNHADAIAKGWRMSKGEILAWLNADDLWETPDAVNQVVDFFKENPETSVVYGDCGKIDAEGNQIGMSYCHEWDLKYAVEYCDHCIPQPAAFIRKNILEKVGWLDTDFPSKKDHELWLRIGLNGEITHIPVLLGHARDIEGLSQDGKTVAKSCLQVTRKFYSLPNVPPKLRRKKWRALSNSYLKGMDYAYSGGRHWKLVFSYALYAALVNPTNLINVLRRFRRALSVGAEEGIQDNRIAFRFGWKIINMLLGNSHLLRRIIGKIRFSFPRLPNLLGDRDIEWSWIASHMPTGPGEALDFGSGCSPLALVAAQKGYNVTTIDLRSINFTFLHSRIHHMQGDIFKLPLPLEKYDLIINCSTVEHVGLAGRYGVTQNLENGDVEAMLKLKSLMKPGGIMLLTVPVGKDQVCPPLCRVYGAERLPLLLQGFSLVKEAYWAKDKYNRWVLCDDKEWVLNQKANAKSKNPLRNVYALGCFVLKKE